MAILAGTGQKIEAFKWFKSAAEEQDKKKFFVFGTISEFEQWLG